MQEFLLRCFPAVEAAKSGYFPAHLRFRINHCFFAVYGNFFVIKNSAGGLLSGAVQGRPSRTRAYWSRNYAKRPKTGRMVPIFFPFLWTQEIHDGHRTGHLNDGYKPGTIWLAYRGPDHVQITGTTLV